MVIIRFLQSQMHEAIAVSRDQIIEGSKDSPLFRGMDDLSSMPVKSTILIEHHVIFKNLRIYFSGLFN